MVHQILSINTYQTNHPKFVLCRVTRSFKILPLVRIRRSIKNTEIIQKQLQVLATTANRTPNQPFRRFKPRLALSFPFSLLILAILRALSWLFGGGSGPALLRCSGASFPPIWINPMVFRQNKWATNRKLVLSIISVYFNPKQPGLVHCSSEEIYQKPQNKHHWLELFHPHFW